MTSAVIAAARPMWTPARALLLGGLTVGVLDGFDALVFFGLRGVPQRPWIYGPLYGLLVYAVMNFVVIPLSAVAARSPSTSVLVNGLLIHALGVGLPAALSARAARTMAPTPASS